MNIFGVMNILWLSFWGNYKIGLDLEVIFMHFNVKVQNGWYFLGKLKFKIFFLISLIFWGVEW